MKLCINKISWLKPKLLVYLSTFLAINSQAQVSCIEIDPITNNVTKVMPYNKSFCVSFPIEAEGVSSIYIVEQHKYYNLGQSISHYVESSSSSIWQPTELPSQYYNVHSKENKNVLTISFDNEYMLQPSSAYFIIIGLTKTDPSVQGFFDSYNLYRKDTSKRKHLDHAIRQLRIFEDKMKQVFGEGNQFIYFTQKEFLVDTKNPKDSLKNKEVNPQFIEDFESNLLNKYTSFDSVKHNYTNFITGVKDIKGPNLDSLTIRHLYTDARITKDALTFLYGKDFNIHRYASDLATIERQNKMVELLSGGINLECIFCDNLNLENYSVNNIQKRIINIDLTLKSLNDINRTLNLLRPRKQSLTSINNSLDFNNKLISVLLESKGMLTNLLNLRKSIDESITTKIFVGSKFNLSSVVSGNSYLNFETRNRVLLTPDFGVVSSRWNQRGEDLEYGIVPYLGFHVNLMAVDKDIPFDSYKKNWRQYLSLMVGWSLVDMDKEEDYSNFFEKSSLLTGVGFRLNNVIRLTAGSQWLFKIKREANGENIKRNLTAIPYLGVSFDLNIKQYLNGFVDVLSGIGKTNLKQEKETVENFNQ